MIRQIWVYVYGAKVGLVNGAVRLNTVLVILMQTG